MNLRQLLVTYFDDPVMTKTNNAGGFSIYKARIKTLLLNQYRYIVAMTEQDAYLPGREVPLKNLRWTVFQTMYHAEIEQCRTHNYHPKTVQPYVMPIHIESKQKGYSRYKTPNLKASIDLLGDDEYPVRGTLMSALETYNTVVSLNS